MFVLGGKKMTTSQSILIAVEITVSLLIIWGLIHEDKLIAFEHRIAKYIGIAIRKHRRKKQLARKKNSAAVTIRRETYNPMIVHDSNSGRGYVA